jgi:hypothetical protein
LKPLLQWPAFFFFFRFLINGLYTSVLIQPTILQGCSRISTSDYLTKKRDIF